MGSALPALTLYYAAQAISVLLLTVMSAQAGMPIGQVLGSFDGNWFMEIAEHGYRQDVVIDANGKPSEVSLAFFPLYPGVVGAFTAIGIPVLTSGIIVSLVAGGVAAWGLSVLGTEIADRRTGTMLVAVWAIAPGSVVLHMVYSEALFCALAVWTLVALHRRQWLTAGSLALLAGLTRSTAAALIAAVGVAALIAIVRRRDGWRPYAAALIAPLGLLGYLLYVAARSGRLDGWFWLQAEVWYLGFDGGAFTWEQLGNALTGEVPGWAVLVALIVLGTIVLLAWSYTVPLPPAVHVYATLMVVSALGTSQFWQSRPRFLLPAFTIVVPIAILLAKLPNRVLGILLPVGLLASAWFGGYLLTVGGMNP
ncbi:hypothetical protein BAY61_00480 [Prauserella marina]|nr:hypothetical protein BAY61_00480 [Prauserella marina]